MKKLLTIAIVLAACLVIAQPAEPVVEKEVTAVKIDDKTVEVTTVTTTTTETPKRTSTTTSTVVEQLDKADLETELHHLIIDRLAELQEQVDKVNERKDELIELLNVFK